MKIYTIKQIKQEVNREQRAVVMREALEIVVGTSLIMFIIFLAL